MMFVLEHPEPRQRKGMPEVRYVSYAHGRGDIAGYLSFTDRLEKAKTWKTLAGAKRYLERHTNLARAGFQVVQEPNK